MLILPSINVLLYTRNVDVTWLPTLQQVVHEYTVQHRNLPAIEY